MLVVSIAGPIRGLDRYGTQLIQIAGTPNGVPKLVASLTVVVLPNDYLLWNERFDITHNLDSHWESGEVLWCNTNPWNIGTNHCICKAAYQWSAELCTKMQHKRLQLCWPPWKEKSHKELRNSMLVSKDSALSLQHSRSPHQDWGLSKYAGCILR